MWPRENILACGEKTGQRGMKSSGVSSTRNLVREAKAARAQQEKQETCFSFRRGLRYFEPRIAHVGISVFMCHDVRRRVYGTDQSPVFFHLRQPGNFLQLPSQPIRTRIY